MVFPTAIVLVVEDFLPYPGLSGRLGAARRDAGGAGENSPAPGAQILVQVRDRAGINFPYPFARKGHCVNESVTGSQHLVQRARRLGVPDLGMVLVLSRLDFVWVDSVADQTVDRGDEDTRGLVGVGSYKGANALLHRLLVAPRFQARIWPKRCRQVFRILPAAGLLFFTFGVRREVDDSLCQFQGGRSLPLIGPVDQQIRETMWEASPRISRVPKISGITALIAPREVGSAISNALMDPGVIGLRQLLHGRQHFFRGQCGPLWTGSALATMWA